MSLITSVTADKLNNRYNDFKVDNRTKITYNHRDYLIFLATTLDEDFQQADLSSSNFDITPPAGSLSFDIASGLGQIAELSRKITDYWKLAVGLGAATTQTEVVAVTNDAEKIYQPIYDGWLSLARGGVLTGNYEAFVEIIYSNVKTIVWTIDEGTGGTVEATYTGDVS